MNFYDSVAITIYSGKGGDGCASARREKYIAYGWPNGGNGGRGGSIIFRATHNEMTLLPYKQTKIFKASEGMPGQTKEMYGEGAEDRILEVPCWTLIKDAKSWDVLAHLANDGESYIALYGGRGWVGNMHFKSSQKQFANFALLGEPGQMKHLVLELMLLADVALIGTPSVGKSSLINVVSDVKAKTAEYPFTTLVPNLGMISHKGVSFSMIDVPGLIEGASQWKWLGNEFLRHIIKSRIFVFCIDSSRFDMGLEEFPLLFQEIQQYLTQRHGSALHHEIKMEEGKIARYIYTPQAAGSIPNTEINEAWSMKYKTLLYKKHIIPLLTKIDTIPDQTVLEMVKSQLVKLMQTTWKAFSKKLSLKEITASTMEVSILLPETTTVFLDHIISYLNDTSTLVSLSSDEQTIVSKAKRDRRQPEISDITDKEITILIEGWYLQATDKDFIKIWSVNHPEISYLTFVTPWWNTEAEIRYRQTLDKEWYLKAYAKAGGRKGDVFKVTSWYQGQEDKYILWD